MPNEFEAWIFQQVGYVAFGPGVEVVNAQNIVPEAQEALLRTGVAA